MPRLCRSNLSSKSKSLVKTGRFWGSMLKIFSRAKAIELTIDRGSLTLKKKFGTIIRLVSRRIGKILLLKLKFTYQPPNVVEKFFMIPTKKIVISVPVKQIFKVCFCKTEIGTKDKQGKCKTPQPDHSSIMLQTWKKGLNQVFPKITC